LLPPQPIEPRTVVLPDRIVQKHATWTRAPGRVIQFTA
jgi:hypothetical protein